MRFRSPGLKNLDAGNISFLKTGMLEAGHAPRFENHFLHCRHRFRELFPAWQLWIRRCGANDSRCFAGGGAAD
jgi:hypothetical protein